MKVVIVGGGAAGMATASRIRRLDKNAEITVFEKSSYVSYAPCGIPYYIGGLISEVDKLIHYPVKFFKEKRNIDVHTHSEVINIDTSGHSVNVIENGNEISKNWDALVIATGARPIRPLIPGIDLKGIYTLRHIEDGVMLRRELLKANNIIVVGGGYIGLEVTENLINLGKRVTLIEMLPHVLPTIDHDMAELIERELLSKGVILKLKEKVIAFEGKDKVKKVITNKNEYPADLVVLSVGVRPDVELAKKAGIRLGTTGAIEVDNKMRTNVKNVYAVGDSVETTHIVTGKRVWVPLAPIANKMGYVAGTNIVGGSLEFPGIVGTSFTKVFDLHIARTGLTEAEAKKEGLEVITAKIEAMSRAAYYPNPKTITLKVIAEKYTKRLLGAQAIGSEGVTGRINVIATLLQHRATANDLFFTDLGYAPPFAPVWDPLIIASRILMRQ